MENNLVKVETDDGKTINLLILEEFDYKKKKYALLSELDECNCGDDCKCGDECHCDDDCKCDNECHCENCECENHGLYLLEITKDKDGNEIFKSIDDDKLFDEVSDHLDKILEK